MVDGKGWGYFGIWSAFFNLVILRLNFEINRQPAECSSVLYLFGLPVILVVKVIWWSMSEKEGIDDINWVGSTSSSWLSRD